MGDLKEFSWAVASNWVVLMSGIASVVSGCVAVWLRARGKSELTANVFWAICVVCLFTASFFVWRDEHHLRINTEKSLADLSTPRLQGHIDQIEVGHTAEHRAVVLLWVSIRNLGADSIVDTYTLKTTLLDGSSSDLFPTMLPPYILFEDVGLEIDTSQGALYDKTSEQPIPRGASRTGILFFFSDTIPSATLQQASIKFGLSFNNVLGKTETAYYTINPAISR